MVWINRKVHICMCVCQPNISIQNNMTDERNFRSSYYEKVGCYSVEEKKSLNKLLQDNIRNHAKLKQFCLCYTVPTTERPILWQLILGILPLHIQSTEFVWEQRKAVYEDLLRAVKCMNYVDAKTTKCRVFYFMWLLENNRVLHPNSSGSENDNSFLEIVQALLQIFEDDVQVYWIAKEFFATCMKDIRQELPKLKELTQTVLKREDIILYNHLENLGVFKTKECLIDRWYTTGFAGLFGESALVRVFDKICGGSTKIVIFLFLELVKTFRERILKCNSINDLRSIVDKVREQDTSIVKRALSNMSDSETQKTSLSELKDSKK